MAERRLSDEQLRAELEARYPREMGVEGRRPKYTVETPEEDDRPISTTPDGRPIFRPDHVSHQGRPRKVWPLREDIVPDHTPTSARETLQLGITEPGVSAFTPVEKTADLNNPPQKDNASTNDLSKGLGS